MSPAGYALLGLGAFGVFCGVFLALDKLARCLFDDEYDEWMRLVDDWAATPRVPDYIPGCMDELLAEAEDVAA